MIQKLIQSQNDLRLVETELLEIWNSIETHKKTNLLVTVYNNFVNDIFKGYHIKFFA